MKILKIFGPPGTGKTRTLLELLEQELKSGVPADRIAFLTFTRAAREEAQKRAKEHLPYCKTIHSICYAMLKLSPNRMMRPRHLQEFGASLGIELSGRSHDPWLADELGEATWEPPTREDRLLQLNHLGRHRMENLNEALRFSHYDLELKYAKWFTLAYRQWKDRNGLYDYTDLLTSYLAEHPVLPVDVVFVDEAQDLSRLQWEVVRALSAGAQRMYVAGDDDQAIFTWAGADGHAFVDLASTDTRILSASHRLSRAVHAVAQDIASRISRRVAKEYQHNGRDGSYDVIPILDLGDLNGGRTFVLYRHHYRGRALAKEMEAAGFPYYGPDSPLGEPRVKGCIRATFHFANGGPVIRRDAAYLVDAADPKFLAPGCVELTKRGKAETVTWQQVLTVQPRHVGEIFRICPRLPKLNYLEKVWQANGHFKATTTLMSIHQSKGQEADVVVLDTDLSMTTWESMQQQPDEEHRVWYVGATRAKERLMSLMPTGVRSYQI